MLRGKFIAIRGFLKTLERSYTNNLAVHLKTLEQRSKHTQKGRDQEIIKWMTKINEIETKRTIQRINETKSWFFEKISKINPYSNELKGKERVSK